MTNGLFGGGDGTALHPYLVEDKADFEQMVYLGSATPKRYYKLMNDLDFQNELWNNTNGFGGHFNGNGFKIKNLNINRQADYSGLFLSINSGGFVENLTVEGRVKGTTYVGGIAGSMHGNIRNCLFKGIVEGTTYVGGITGHVSVSNDGVLYCMVQGEVRGTSYVGGISGNSSRYTSIKNCVCLLDKICRSMGSTSYIFGDISGVYSDHPNCLTIDTLEFVQL